MRGWSAALAVLLLGGSIAFPADKIIDNFSLQDYRGKSHSLADFGTSKIVVVAFLGVECPLAKLYAPVLQTLADQYAAQGASFVAINSNRHDSVTEMAAFVRLHGLKLPFLKDTGNLIADRFDAQRTPEVFLLDESRIVRYRGRIDDRFGFGVARDSAKSHDLENALKELLAGKPVSKPRTESTGCLIGRVKTPKSDAKVTYSNQIARLFQRRCVECHRDGDIGPFALSNYQEAAGWAEMIREVVDAGRMPPWHADPKFGKFADDRRLTPEERSLIRQWTADGAPEGDPKFLPEPRTFATGWHQIKAPDLVLPMRATPFQIPAEGEVRYQYFVVDPRLKEDKWITASEVLPSNRSVVHHLLVLVNDPQASFDESRGGAGGFLAAYVPGLRPKPYPLGMAKRLAAGSKLIFQIHYTPNGSPQQDLSKLGLWFTDEKAVTHEVKTVSAATRNFRIPPHAANHEVKASSRELPVDAQLLAMMPHMHLRGKAFRYDLALPDGKHETLLDVPTYDFNWQTAYRLDALLPLPRGAKVLGTAHFDNSENNLSNPDPSQAVRWGDQTYEEMMIGYFDIAIAKEKMPEFRRATAGNGVRGRLADGLRQRFGAEALLKRFDKNGDGVIDRNEIPENLQAAFDRLDQNGDGKVDRKELAAIGRQP